jgi:NAD(P)H-dependent FMN reductase
LNKIIHLPNNPLLAFAGSSRPDSSNARLLDELARLFPDRDIRRTELPAQLPLFRAEADRHPWPPRVLDWRREVAAAGGLIIATPAYLDNLPALVKNALEWLTSSGELTGKPVLAITLTPHPPRGERALQALLWSLSALEANVLAQLPLYQSDFEKSSGGLTLPDELQDLLREAIGLFG